MTTIIDKIDRDALPACHDADRAEDTLAEWRAALDSLDGEDTVLRSLREDATAEAVIRALAGNSPFLANLILRHPAFAARALTHPLVEVRDDVIDSVAALAADPPAANDLKRALRRAREQVSLLVAAADITGLWDLEMVTDSLSRFAETAVQAAVVQLLEARYTAGDLAPPENATTPEDRAAASGYTVLAMGKLGARELNYSSDIDLIVLFDPEVVRYTGNRSLQDCFVRVTRELVHYLQERTEDGYVFRVDLRLRPDPGATAIALSVDAAEFYYQSAGLNWERSAMIKARPIAGDIQAGADFLDRIKGFVWRKHLDYAAVEDIHDIKRRIHSHHRHRGITVAGQDIKLGYGGIREIEFFAQIHQLIAGGREHDLRVPQTTKAVAALREAGKIDAEEAETLTESYRYLRRLEHRLQMIRDEQTQVLPSDDAELAHLATFMGYADTGAFRDDLIPRLEAVHTLYDGLFEETHGAPAEEAEGEIEWQRFSDPEKARSFVETWALGRYRACRTERARAILKTLTPAIVNAFAHSSTPDTALLRFDEFLAKLPSGVQLFSLIQAHPWLLELLAEIMGSAPALADTLSRNPLLLDAVLTADFFDPVPDADSLAADLEERLSHADHFEGVLDAARRWAGDRKFQIGVQILRQVIDAEQAGRDMTRLAEVVIRTLYPRVIDEFAERHGHLPGGMVVVGMGKLGAGELTFRSDLDLIFVYEARADSSDGARPLAASQYFARLSQRLINAISALTAEGRLWEVDMRLRPSGRAGPIAVGLDAFLDYQKNTAWTWEHMALTRARPIVGPDELMAKASHVIREILTTPRRDDTLLHHVSDMRRRMDDQFGTDDPWNTKYVRGGLLDIEFIVQFLLLKTAPQDPSVLNPAIGEAIRGLIDAGAIPAETGESLSEDYRLLQRVQAFLRLCYGKEFQEDTAGDALLASLARFTGFRDFPALKNALLDTQARVYETYKALIGAPAADLAPDGEEIPEQAPDKED